MMIIRLFLILLFFPAFFLVVRVRTARFKAIRVLMLIGLMLVTSCSILFPGTWQKFAELLGVGKGADLLLYLLSVAFITFVGLVLRKLRDMEFRTSLVVQEIALQGIRRPKDIEIGDDA
jgi:hypothetical protein